MTITALSPEEARTQIALGARLIDIRDADEYAREHIPDAELVPLSALNGGATLHATADETPAQVRLLTGGIQAWKAAGLPVAEDKSQPLPLMRQVQIAAGGLVLLGVVLGYGFGSGFFLLSALVGAGLIFAGITGFCGMARLLAVMPWNRR